MSRYYEVWAKLLHGFSFFLVCKPKALIGSSQNLDGQMVFRKMGEAFQGASLGYLE